MYKDISFIFLYNLAMRFEVKIENHQRLEQFLNRVNTLRHWNLYNEDQQTASLQERRGVVDISYLALLKHIAIGGNGYSRGGFQDINLNLITQNNNIDIRIDEYYNRVRSRVFLFRNFIKKFWLCLDFIGSFFSDEELSLLWNWNFPELLWQNHQRNNFILRGFSDFSDKGVRSYKIWQGVASYLSSEIDNVFFLLPYDEVKRQISRQARENNQQDPFDQDWEWNNRPDLVGFYLHEGEPSPIVIEAKGYSNKPSNTQINNWKIQAASSGIQVPYSVVAATYHLYKKWHSPKCLYKDPKTLPGYELTNKDYARLLNVYYQPFNDLVKNFENFLQEKEIQGVKYCFLNIWELLSKIPCLYNLLDCLDYHYLYRSCFSFISQHNLYLRKDFLYTDWANKKDFSLFKEHHKIQEPNLYIDYDWIWFGIED